MKKVMLGKSGQQVPAVIVGCMRLGGKGQGIHEPGLSMRRLNRGRIISTMRTSMRTGGARRFRRGVE